jgi:hypothetical protein
VSAALTPAAAGRKEAREEDIRLDQDPDAQWGLAELATPGAIRECVKAFDSGTYPESAYD